MQCALCEQGDESSDELILETNEVRGLEGGEVTMHNKASQAVYTTKTQGERDKDNRPMSGHVQVHERV